MSAVVESASYRELLERYAPAPIKSREANQQALEVFSTLMAKGEENLSPDEQKFAELLGMLISQFEKTAYPAPKGAPADILRELMRARGMRPKDLWPVFGSKGITSEVLRGKRGISKERAKLLAEMFGVSVELFI